MKRTIQLLPLRWPRDIHGRPWPRNHAPKPSRFGDVTVKQAATVLYHQCRLIPGVVEASIHVHAGDGSFNPGAHVDHGAAVFFAGLAGPVGFGADQFTKVSHNLWALAKHIEAMRAIERWGVGTSQQMFAGYTTALPPAPSARKPWHVVLGFDTAIALITEEEINQRHRSLTLKHHPDKPGGSAERMAEINNARDEALKELSARKKAS